MFLIPPFIRLSSCPPHFSFSTSTLSFHFPPIPFSPICFPRIPSSPFSPRIPTRLFSALLSHLMLPSPCLVVLHCPFMSSSWFPSVVQTLFPFPHASVPTNFVVLSSNPTFLSPHSFPTFRPFLLFFCLLTLMILGLSPVHAKSTSFTHLFFFFRSPSFLFSSHPYSLPSSQSCSTESCLCHPFYFFSRVSPFYLSLSSPLPSPFICSSFLTCLNIAPLLLTPFQSHVALLSLSLSLFPSLFSQCIFLSVLSLVILPSSTSHSPSLFHLSFSIPAQPPILLPSSTSYSLFPITLSVCLSVFFLPLTPTPNLSPLIHPSRPHPPTSSLPPSLPHSFLYVVYFFSFPSCVHPSAAAHYILFPSLLCS